MMAKFESLVTFLAARAPGPVEILLTVVVIVLSTRCGESLCWILTLSSKSVAVDAFVRDSRH